MGTKEKLLKRFLSFPKDFTWDELTRMLEILGYTCETKGKTSGSRMIYKCDGRNSILLHRPHPGNIMKGYVLKQVFTQLTKDNVI